MLCVCRRDGGMPICSHLQLTEVKRPRIEANGLNLEGHETIRQGADAL